jgi:uncharacterized membrane protein
MTSVPLGFWPDNLSSLAWVGICVALLGSSICNDLIPSLQWNHIIANIIMICLLLFVVDQLILGPLYYFLINRNEW